MNKIPEHDNSKNQVDRDLSEFTREQWETALAIKNTIESLFQLPRCTRADVKAAAGNHGISLAWMYQLIKKYRNIGTTSCLIPQPKNGGRGIGRISKRDEKLIQSVIEEYYLDEKNLKPSQVYDEYKHECRKRGLKAVAPNTFRNRIRKIPARTVTHQREGWRKARDKFDPIVDEFPRPKWPLDVVQMDHTPTDIIVVDEEFRAPIGRLNLTIAVDMYSRCTLGYMMSLEAPSAATVALALAHAVAPKTAWLKDRGIVAKWPMYGKMSVLHVDNGPDFWSESLDMGCENNGIDIEYRPVKHPKYGGTVERLFKTLNRVIHSYDGTTKSNSHEKGDYKSEDTACLTIAELEKCLVRAIEIYHNKSHSKLLIPPMLAWKEGIEGINNQPGRGNPKRLVNERRFLIDFLPLERRTIQRYGFVWDHIRYYDDVLRSYIDNDDKRKFIIRRDPRDISKIYFFCPETNQYYEIPYRNLQNPSITLFEWISARRRLREKGRLAEDEDAMFRAHEANRRTIEQAREKTKHARRQSERRRSAEKSHNRLSPEPDHKSTRGSTPHEPSLSTNVSSEDTFDYGETFDDIDTSLSS